MKTQSSVAMPRRRARPVVRFTLGVVVLSGLIVGCGQKGPLTLPSTGAASAPAR